MDSQSKHLSFTALSSKLISWQLTYATCHFLSLSLYIVLSRCCLDIFLVFKSFVKGYRWSNGILAFRHQSGNNKAQKEEEEAAE